MIKLMQIGPLGVGVLAAMLAGPAAAEEPATFSALDGVPAETMSAPEMAAVEGKAFNDGGYYKSGEYLAKQIHSWSDGNGGNFGRLDEYDDPNNLPCGVDVYSCLSDEALKRISDQMLTPGLTGPR